jgi:hypothetical protein
VGPRAGLNTQARVKKNIKNHFASARDQTSIGRSSRLWPDNILTELPGSHRINRTSGKLLRNRLNAFISRTK